MYDENTKQRTSAQREFLLNRLRQAKSLGVSTHELKNTGMCYTARISELRKIGYKIDCEKVDDTNFNYILVYEPSHLTSMKKPIDRLFDAWGNKAITKEELLNLLNENKLQITTMNGGLK